MQLNKDEKKLLNREQTNFKIVPIFLQYIYSIHGCPTKKLGGDFHTTNTFQYEAS